MQRIVQVEARAKRALTLVRGVALLPLYDWPEFHARTDELWAMVRRAGRDEGLDLPVDLGHPGHKVSAWMSDNLVFTQLCGAPWYRHYRDQTRYLATSALGIPGAPAGNYFSKVVVRADSGYRALEDLAHARLAYNDIDSQSGVHCLRPLMDVTAKLHTGLKSCGHRHSMDAVISGDADFAAIDAFSFGLYRHLNPDVTAQVRIIANTPPRPAPVLVAARSVSEGVVGRLRRTVLTALTAAAGGFYGAVDLGVAAYRIYEQEAGW